MVVDKGVENWGKNMGLEKDIGCSSKGSLESF